MGTRTRTLTLLAAAGGGAAAVAAARALRARVRRSRGRPERGEGRDAGRWLVVTVHRSPQDVHTGELPGPLRPLREQLEVRVRPAPGDRGTELAVRLRQPPGRLRRTLAAGPWGVDPLAEVRLALRRAKSLLEAGEIVRGDAPAPGGRPATDRARGRDDFGAPGRDGAPDDGGEGMR